MHWLGRDLSFHSPQPVSLQVGTPTSTHLVVLPRPSGKAGGIKVGVGRTPTVVFVSTYCAQIASRLLFWFHFSEKPFFFAFQVEGRLLKYKFCGGRKNVDLCTTFYTFMRFVPRECHYKLPWNSGIYIAKVHRTCTLLYNLQIMYGLKNNLETTDGRLSMINFIWVYSSGKV